MIPIFLTKIKTKDKVILDGIVVKPKRKSYTALVWLHGLSSRFSSGQTLIKEMSGLCQKNKIGYFKFNTRGHDIASRAPKELIGGGFEKFKDCILDIKAMIRCAKKMGYKKIILAGHSTGANKALYYLYKTRDRSVEGLILLGPINDYVAEIKKAGWKIIKRGLTVAQKLKKNPYTLMPREFGLYSCRRYLSLYAENSEENTFPYNNPKAKWKELNSVKAPIAVILGSRDEYLDRPAKKLAEIFRSKAHKTKSFSSIIIKDAKHGFQRKEKELAEKTISWLKRAIA